MKLRILDLAEVDVSRDGPAQHLSLPLLSREAPERPEKSHC
jgi:hypothetical protein